MYLALLLLGCGGEPAVRPTHAPPPFTADQLRAGFVHDRTWTFRVEGGTAPIRVMRYLSATDAGVMVWNQEEDGLGGPVGEPKVSEATWAEFAGQATWNAEITTITEVVLTTPAGTYPCLLYTVSTPVGVTRAWFAKDIPGPPVRVVETSLQQAPLVMELIQFKPGE